MADGERGRPRRWPEHAPFAERVEGYFSEREGDGRPPSIAGLARYLGFSDRHALTEYEGYGDDFSATIKSARLRIEEDRTERLLSKDGSTAGVIFDLKNNYGWKDQQHQELSGKVITEVRRTLVRPSHSDG